MPAAVGRQGIGGETSHRARGEPRRSPSAFEGRAERPECQEEVVGGEGRGQDGTESPSEGEMVGGRGQPAW